MLFVSLRYTRSRNWTPGVLKFRDQKRRCWTTMAFGLLTILRLKERSVTEGKTKVQ